MEFAGEAVHAYLGHLPDADIEAMLNSSRPRLARRSGKSASMSLSPTGLGFWMPGNVRRNRSAVAVSPGQLGASRLVPPRACANFDPRLQSRPDDECGGSEPSAQQRRLGFGLGLVTGRRLR